MYILLQPCEHHVNNLVNIYCEHHCKKKNTMSIVWTSLSNFFCTSPVVYIVNTVRTLHFVHNAHTLQMVVMWWENVHSAHHTLCTITSSPNDGCFFRSISNRWIWVYDRKSRDLNLQHQSSSIPRYPWVAPTQNVNWKKWVEEIVYEQPKHKLQDH